MPQDARGKPLLGNDDPNPECHYNAYKFDTSRRGQPRIMPDWLSSCIDADNEFSGGSLEVRQLPRHQGSGGGGRAAARSFAGRQRSSIW